MAVTLNKLTGYEKAHKKLHHRRFEIEALNG